MNDRDILRPFVLLLATSCHTNDEKGRIPKYQSKKVEQMESVVFIVHCVVIISD